MGQGMDGEKPPENAEHPAYISVYQAVGGWQTQCVWWNPDMLEGGYEEPWSTGNGPYRYQLAARAEAEMWGKAWGLEVRGLEGAADPAPAQGVRETLRQAIQGIIEVDLPTLRGRQ